METEIVRFSPERSRDRAKSGCKFQQSIHSRVTDALACGIEPVALDGLRPRSGRSGCTHLGYNHILPLILNGAITWDHWPSAHSRLSE
jgi:hypothetical protein